MPRVLVVEDSPTQALELQLILESKNFEVQPARDGREGLRQLEAGHFDIVLSDVMMPGMSGYEFCRTIKADPRHREVPIVLLTTLKDPTDIVEGLEAGADNFITKPYEPDYLLGRIKTILDHQASRVRRPTEVGVEMVLMGKKIKVTSHKEQIVGLLVSAAEEAIRARRREDESLKAQEALEQNQRFLESMVNALPASIAVLDHAGKIIAANAAWARLAKSSQLPETQWGVGANYLEVCASASAPLAVASAEVAAGIRQVMGNERDSLCMEIPCRAPEGDRWFIVQLNRITGAQPVRVVVAIEETTERRLGEEKLKRTTDELARSNRELEQFAYVASHDLQEPLRMVASYVQLLEERYRGRLDAEAEEFIGYAAEGAKRMHQLILDLLAFSRVGTHVKPFQPVDCESLLKQALANLQVAIAESGAVITHGALPTLRVDDTQLAQLFQNLIANAIKFHNGKPPAVHIEAEHREGEWLFRVRDNGIGFDPKHAERIFVVFQRLHTREKYPGTGIGLAICKKIVERHHGRMWADSQCGEGSTFYFTIPDPDVDR